MQAIQSPTINRQRKAQVLAALCLAMTGFFILMSFPVLGRSSQGVSEIKLSIDDPRPVAKAILMLEEKYGWVITYEDPRYVHDSEITDVTLKVRRDLDKYEPGEAHKVLIPRQGVLEFAYDVVPNTNLPPDPARVVQRLLDAQAVRGTGGRFRLESRGKIMHVIPTAIKNRAGVLIPQESMLDTIISLPAADRTVYDKLESICAIISRATKIRIGIAAYPTMFHEFRDRQGAVSQKARDVLVNTFATIESGDGVSWRLLYDPGLNRYLLNIYHVSTLDGKT
jgi:hypothetical protein